MQLKIVHKLNHEHQFDCKIHITQMVREYRQF